MKKIKIICFTVLSLLAISCSDSFFDVNTDQNSPTFSTPELTLPAAQKYTVDLLEGGYNSFNTLGNLWSNSWAAAGDYAYFDDETHYNVTSAFRTGNFTTSYLLPLANYDYVEKNVDPKYDNYVAIAKIMKAFHFQYLVDMYGDVPYTEAFLRGANTTPKYDDAKTIYDDLLVQLTDAQTLIANPSADAVNPGANDIMCGGDMTKWAKFANTLKLRILLRQSEIGVTDYSSVNNGIGFLGAGETVYCNPGYIALVSGKQNPFYNAFKIDDTGAAASNAGATRATSYGLNVFDVNDTRKPFYWKKVGANYVSIEQNDLGGQPATSLSGIGDGILKSATMPGIIMQSAESLFLQAEAAARTSIAGNAQALYNQAVQEAYSQVGAGSASSETTAGAAYEFPTAGTLAQKVSAIYKQKYIALMSTNGIENWIEARRVNYPIPPAVAPNGGLIGPGTIPVRLLYPFSEISTNGANVPTQVQNDAFVTKIFWDN